MQQQRAMVPQMPALFPASNITTEQIQSFLDENKKLILAILDNQNLGKLSECAQYQAKLQHNLMYLAAIADAQPQAPPVHSHMPPPVALQTGGHFMQHPQVGPAQHPFFAPKVLMQFNPQQMQEPQQLHHQHPSVMQAHIGMRPGPNNGVHAMHTEATLGGSSAGLSSATGLPEFSHGGVTTNSFNSRGNKHEGGGVPEVGSGDGGHGGPTTPGGVDGEPSYMKGSDEGTN
ncbi:GRF1-interacting factor 2-like isoform X2 [Aristolochia californica]|uniref:GRF1-interacting factor 2-like isoform X2 n=1 Tax=Aristolochia californica TaxID=171875 RepID=UPI0035DC5C8B